MALTNLMLQEVAKRVKPGMRVASMGYPDVIADPKEVERVLGAQIYSLKYHDEHEGIAAFHGVKHKIPVAESFFAAMGAQLDVYDIAKHRGPEIIVDLNEPFASIGGYDIVLDCGTLEHCFNIGCAAINMASMLKRGGMIFHENPFLMGNHGFYGLNPTFYADFYGQPGFKLHELWLMPRGSQTIKNVERQRRFAFQGPETNNLAIAERTEILPVQVVVQWKYRKKIPVSLTVAPAAGGSGVKEAAHG